jgi:sugar phosphate isomerase/epimerase
MPRLRTFANLWTLWDHPGAGPDEWTLAEKVAAVAAAGFDGVMGDPG